MSDKSKRDRPSRTERSGKEFGEKEIKPTRPNPVMPEWNKRSADDDGKRESRDK